MNTAHTPGPWLFRGKSDSVHQPSDTHPYGETIFRFDETDAPSDSDLALILSAPELLAACHAFVEYEQTDEDDGMAMMFAYNACKKAVYAAIAKAVQS